MNFLTRMISPKYHCIKFIQSCLTNSVRRPRSVQPHPLLFSTYVPECLSSPAAKFKIANKSIRKKAKFASVTRSGGLRGGAKKWK